MVMYYLCFIILNIMKTKVINYRGTATIYYAAYQKNLRLSTGYKVGNDKFFLNGEFVKGEKDFKTMNHQINLQKKEIDDLIFGYISQNAAKEPTVEWLKEQLKEKPGDELNPKHRIVDVYAEFHQHIFNNQRLGTYKTYANVKNALNEFCPNMFIEDVGVDFKTDIEVFLSRTKGFANSTVNKRISQLVSFLRWAKQHDYIFNDKFFEISQNVEEKYQEEIIVLYEDELKKLKELEFGADEQRLEKYRDIMLMLSFTGLRWSDFERLNKHHIKEGCIDMIMRKTSKRCVVPVCKTVKDIMGKYNYSWGLAEQNFNDGIKELLKKYEICNYDIKITSFQANQPTEKFVKKYECISSKTGRKTFVSVLITKNTPINLIMRSTGWKRMEQIIAYMEIFGKKDNSFTTVFDSI